MYCTTFPVIPPQTARLRVSLHLVFLGGFSTHKYLCLINYLPPCKLLTFVIPSSKEFRGSALLWLNGVWQVVISMSECLKPSGADLVVTMVRQEWAIMDMLWAWTVEFMTIFFFPVTFFFSLWSSLGFFHIFMFLCFLFVFCCSVVSPLFLTFVFCGLLRHGSCKLGSWMGKDCLAEVSKY